MNRTILIVPILSVAWTVGLGTAAAQQMPGGGAAPKALPPASTKKGVTYASDIKPLFDASCIKCHGADRPKAKLRLDSLEGVLAGGEDGKVIVTGKSEDSKLVKAVARIDPRSAMPPAPRPARRGGPNGQTPPPQPDPPKPLTAEQVGLIRAWIDQGAK
jgi:mono/diheme cytochrome c family protein